LVRELVAVRPDLTLDELHRETGGRGIHVGRASVNRFLQACGLTLKKSRFMPPSSNGRTSRPRARIGVLPNRI
jgi:transposase